MSENSIGIYAQPYGSWKGTGINLDKGYRLTITANESEGIRNMKEGESFFPSGYGRADDSFICPNLPEYALVGKIGENGEPFKIGTDYSETVNVIGELFITINIRLDNAESYDLEGEYQLTVEFEGAPSSASALNEDNDLISQGQQEVGQVDAGKQTKSGLGIKGIDAESAEKLKEQDIGDSEALLQVAGDATGRRRLAKETGIAEKTILGWVNRADLMRVKGVGEKNSDLLEAAGVDTVKELAQRNAENLQMKLDEINEQQELVKAVPSVSKVKEWVQQAKRLKAKVTY